MAHETICTCAHQIRAHAPGGGACFTCISCEAFEAALSPAQINNLRITQNDRIEVVGLSEFNGGRVAVYIRHIEPNAPGAPVLRGVRSNRTREYRATFFQFGSEFPDWAMLCGSPSYTP